MLVASMLLSLTMVTAADSVRRVADTLVIEPLGVRVTIPALWMGRVPAGATLFTPGPGRLGCQVDVAEPLSDRVVTDPAMFPAMLGGIYGPRQSAQDALDSLLPRRAMVASVGGSRFNGSCLAPRVHLYVTDSLSLLSAPVAALAQRVVERVFRPTRLAERDSASWHTIGLSWSDRQTDWVKPGTLELLIRRFGDRLLVVAVLDGWSDRPDANALLASIR